MGKMTDSAIVALYENGKDVFKGVIELDDAAKRVSKEHPEVAESSARHYITWYSRMREGEILTWNSNSKLLLYYAKRIMDEEGPDAGNIALNSVEKFALEKGKTDLAKEVKKMRSEREAYKWWPSISDYNPKISKEQWLEILHEDEIIGPVWGGILAMFFDYGGAATCTQLGQRFKKDPASIRACATQLAKKIHEITACPLFINDNKEHYWTILFQRRQASDSEDGSWVWKLRPELQDALEEYNILKFLPEIDDESMTVKDYIGEIKKYIRSKGYTYPDDLIENFFLCLKSKPFVILAGTSGTGKSKLVQLFAEAIGAESYPVSVRPDWSDSSDLFGHNDLNGNFISGPVCEAFNFAIASPDKPVLLCLDEMNLSRVEYYLSDYLSIIETRELRDGRVITKPIAQYKGGIPDNLYLIGTVNMDETTFPFSKKVLDRANTIEFNFVDLVPQENPNIPSAEALNLPNSFLQTDYLILDDCMSDKEYVLKICKELQALNEILVKANAHVGFRVRDEIAFYMMNNKDSGEILDYDKAMDLEILQKILPRIQGSSAAVKTLLIELFQFCMGNDAGVDPDTGNVGEDMKTKSSAAKYPISAQKLGYMMTRFENDGFTSYWL